MPNKKLLDYIRQQMEMGTTKENIQKFLASSGWTQPDIDSAFVAVANEPVKKRGVVTQISRGIFWALGIIFLLAIIGGGFGASYILNQTKSSIENGTATEIQKSFYASCCVGVFYFEHYSTPVLGYSKDSSHVYFGGKIIQDADPATFEISSTTNSFDAEDKNNKYLMGKIIGTTTEPVPVLFQGTKTLFMKDQNHVYYLSYVDSQNDATDTPHLVEIQKADPSTFEAIARYNHEFFTEEFAKDKNHVYGASREDLNLDIVPDAMPSAFKFLNAFYAKDNSHVFYLFSPSHIVEEADPETFKVFDTEQLRDTAVQFDSQDKNHTYNQGELVNDQVVGTSTAQIPVGNINHTYEEIFKSPNYAFLCYVVLATESNCKLFAKDLSTGEISDLDLTIDYGAADSGSFIVAPDKGMIAIILENKIITLNPSTADKKLLIQAPAREEFGTYSEFPSFMPKAKWMDATHLQYSLYTEGTLDNSNASPLETKIMEVK